VRLWRPGLRPASRLGLPWRLAAKSWLQLIDGSVRLDSGAALERGDALGLWRVPEALISEAEGLTAEAAAPILLLFELLEGTGEKTAGLMEQLPAGALQAKRQDLTFLVRANGARSWFVKTGL